MSLIGTHDDDSDRFLMKNLKNVIEDDLELEDEAHDTYIFQSM